MDSQHLYPPDADPLGARSAAALRELEQRAQAAFAARRDQVSRLEVDITAQLETISAALAQQQAVESTEADQADGARAEIKRLTAELEDVQALTKLERAAWESEREALEQQRSIAEEERTKFQADRASWETQLSTFASERAAWETERASLESERAAREDERVAWEAERIKLAAKAAMLEADQRSSEVDQRASREELRAAQDEWRVRLAELEQNFLDERTRWEGERAEWTDILATRERECVELRQKFELALQDVQRFRGRVTELEQELARRPQTDKADSAELVALRTERDELAARITQLEQAQVPQVDADAEQQMADLQRRFELAVEDVRELKTKNTKLESQLAESRKHSGSPTDNGDMDWESQKRRLLASLEGGGDVDDAADQQERAKIKDTIEMTDAVIAEKDREIASLQAQLATGAIQPAQNVSDREQAIAEILDADEVIAQHRQQVAQLEQELEGKLRAAELELSVERAKIARNRAELETLRVELESQRQSRDAYGGPGTTGVPKRRWLSKLGLTGDEES